MRKLSDELHNDEPEHFTNYDYVLQLCINGQNSEFKAFIKEINHMGLINLLQHNRNELGMHRESILLDEIVNRMESN